MSAALENLYSPIMLCYSRCKLCHSQQEFLLQLMKESRCTGKRTFWKARVNHSAMVTDGYSWPATRALLSKLSFDEEESLRKLWKAWETVNVRRFCNQGKFSTVHRWCNPVRRIECLSSLLIAYLKGMSHENQEGSRAISIERSSFKDVRQGRFYIFIQAPSLNLQKIIQRCILGKNWRFFLNGHKILFFLPPGTSMPCILMHHAHAMNSHIMHDHVMHGHIMHGTSCMPTHWKLCQN